MNQSERRRYLITELLKEQPGYGEVRIPADAAGQKRLLRALMNVRMPGEISEEFLRIQDAYLAEAIREKGVVGSEELTPVRGKLCIWQGDITRLRVDAIVNAANSGMTGCYQPNHSCIDNCIHTYSGLQLRLDCAEMMERQGFPEPTGQAKITPAYNLPSRYVLHTVGPIIEGGYPTRREQAQLASCYRSCLELAAESGCKSIAFCCISTGVFHFPNRLAAKIAVETVEEFLEKDQRMERVIFNVFLDLDKEIYEELLGREEHET